MTNLSFAKKVFIRSRRKHPGLKHNVNKRVFSSIQFNYKSINSLMERIPNKQVDCQGQMN